MTQPQTWARVAGLLYMINIATSVFALMTAQRLFVANDAAQTTTNIMANEPMFRLAFAAIIFAGVVYVAVIAILYVLMKPAGATLSAIAAFMGLAGCAIGASTALNQLGALMYLGDAAYLAAFSQEQLQTLARVTLRASGIGNTIGLVFFGFYCLLLAALVFRARFLPRWLGALLLLAGVGWLIGSFTTFLMPSLGIAGTLIPRKRPRRSAVHAMALGDGRERREVARTSGQMSEGPALRGPLLVLCQACFGLRGARLRFGIAVTGATASPYMLGHGASLDSIVTASPKPLKRVDMVVP